MLINVRLPIAHHVIGHPVYARGIIFKFPMKMK